MCETDPMSHAGVRREIIHAVIHDDEPTYVAECLELAVVTHGKTLDELVENLREALALHLENEDMVTLGLAENLTVEVTYHVKIR